MKYIMKFSNQIYVFNMSEKDAKMVYEKKKTYL